jgi:hypothetical protein
VIFYLPQKNQNGGRKTIMPRIGNRVVARFRDGRIVKGYTYDFAPDKGFFHVTDAEDDKKVVEVSVALMKAVFFVKTFEGYRDHGESEDLARESLEKTPGLKMKVTFTDGEVMAGSTHVYDPERIGFFIFPADKETNNERVFVVRESAESVETWR